LCRKEDHHYRKRRYENELIAPVAVTLSDTLIEYRGRFTPPMNRKIKIRNVRKSRKKKIAEIGKMNHTELLVSGDRLAKRNIWPEAGEYDQSQHNVSTEGIYPESDNITGAVRRTCRSLLSAKLKKLYCKKCKKKIQDKRQTKAEKQEEEKQRKKERKRKRNNNEKKGKKRRKTKKI